MPELPRDTEVVSSDSASPVKVAQVDRYLSHIGASGNDRPPRGDDLPLKPGAINYLRNGRNVTGKTNE